MLTEDQKEGAFDKLAKDFSISIKRTHTLIDGLLEIQSILNREGNVLKEEIQKVIIDTLDKAK